MKRYLSEDIGETYKDWRKGDIVLIETPTGSGKTTFICDILIPYVAKQKKRILYLVNRSILLKQVEDELSKLMFNARICVDVMTYQHLEQCIVYNSAHKLLGYDYVICDEGHYFISDSLFNTNTSISYDWIMRSSEKRTTIFMSATLVEMEKQIREDMKHRGYIKSLIVGYITPLGPNSNHIIREPIVYSGKPDYSYISCNIIYNKEECIDDICKDSEGWLVFVDSVKEGKELCKAINKKFSSLKEDNKGKEIAVFLWSGYRNCIFRKNCASVPEERSAIPLETEQCSVS